MNCPSCQAENVENARFCAKCGEQMPVPEVEEKDTFIGQTVGGRYVVKKILGEGGMGRVYEADRAIAGINQRVAIKTLHQHLSKDPQVVARFHRECRTIAQLKHPNTIKVEDFGQAADGTLYIAMEFVEGNSIEKELELHGAMPPDRVEHIMGQVCGSLAEAHKQGVVHRDLKPDNVVLMDVGDEHDFVKVLDFGIAARKDSTDAAKEAKLTQQGMVLGTPPYMSPEQFMGKELDSRSDIYSLAVMSYEMLTGRLPFEANTPWEWATKHMTAQPFPFEDSPTVNDVPAKMKHAILKAMSKNPAERHATVREFFEDLSIGASRMKGGNTHLGDAGAVSKGTSAMTPYDTGSGEVKGGTQVAIPLSVGAGFASPPTNPGAAGGLVAPAIPPPPPVTSGGSANAAGGSPNKGMLYGIAAVVGVVVLVLLIVIVKRVSGGGTSGDLGPVSSTSVSGPATIAPLGSDTPPTTATTTATTGIKATGTTTTATPAVTGETACQDAKRDADTGNIHGAIALYNHCNGPSQGAARSAIAAKLPTAIRSDAFNNNCAGARSLAGSTGQFGVASVNVDSQYPNCKGK
jgi:serine/threonine-protein kinase